LTIYIEAPIEALFTKEGELKGEVINKIRLLSTFLAE